MCIHWYISASMHEKRSKCIFLLYSLYREGVPSTCPKALVDVINEREEKKRAEREARLAMAKQAGSFPIRLFTFQSLEYSYKWFSHVFPSYHNNQYGLFDSFKVPHSFQHTINTAP